MNSLIGLLFALVLTGALVAAFLCALFFIVRAAVEGGVRRALRDDALRPSVRQLLGHDEVR